MYSLFFELLRVSIGTQSRLSRLPQTREWKKLYELAERQALLGVCFVGLQNLGADAHGGYEHIGIPKDVYFQWLGMAVQIQQRNEILNQQCVELQKRLSVDGFSSSILKGQGVALAYPECIRQLRQSGDIDIWVGGLLNDNIKKFRDVGIALTNINIKHAEARIFDGTTVEIHFTPSWFYNPIIDRRFQEWIKEQAPIQMQNKQGSLIIPNHEFNAVYLLLHIYRHLLDEGVGMRQLIDYYVTLKACYQVADRYAIASSVMWILQEILGLDTKYLLCEPNSKEGAMLLNEIMEGGNFGHFDKRINHVTKNTLGRGWQNLRKNQRYLFLYPSEVIWAPLWKVWHWCWRFKVN